MDTTKTVTHISLCAGYGGIDLGLRGAISNLRTVAFSEVEGFACANLVSKMEAGLLDCAPIWTDLKTFPWRAFRDRVDILSGGYPCQPFSAAGKRLGTEDPRHLWPYIADGIRILRPRFCFFENVEGHISLGLREVISELESMGYKVSWGIFSAREVGAPHQRKRVFILAMANNGGKGLERNFSGLFNAQGREKQSRSTGRGSGFGGEIELANSNGARGWEDRESSESCPTCTEQPSSDSRGSESRQIREGQAWPSRPGELADTSDGTDTASGHAETHRLPSEYREAVCSGESGGANADAWPSRPGEPQHGWEPPRVVANSASERTNEGHQLCDEECGQGRALPLQSNDSGEGMGNADCFDRRTSASGWINDAEAGSAGEIMGNSKDERCGRMDDEPSEVSGGETRGHADWSSNPEQQEQWQAESTMGRNAYGTPNWMDYAELSVSCDNRTDELRLLGNGVVPATATLAFQTLLAELLAL